MKTNKIVRTETLKSGNFEVIITASLDDDCKNGHEDFFITYDMYQCVFGRRDWISGGCAEHSGEPLVRKAINKFGLKPVEKLHLCDMHGVPMYPIRNGRVLGLRDYLRLTDEEADELQYIHNGLSMYNWLKENGVLDRWQKEADEAIKAIINGRDIEFESTASKPMGHWDCEL